MTEQVVEAGQVEAEAKEVVAEAAAQEAPAPLAAGGGTPDEASKTPATWPEDWRDKLAGGDEKVRARLDRFHSPQNVLSSWLALEKRMSSGEVKAALPENPSDEQLATWRKENGIPSEPAEYLAELPEGLVVGDADKPVMTAFAEKMHGLNAPPAVVKEAVAWYFTERENQLAAQAEADREFQRKAEDELRAEWGAEFRLYQTGITNFAKSMPDGLGDMLLAARLPDGTRFGDNPAALRWMASLVSEMNPAATVVPAGTSDADKGMNDRIAEIEDALKNDPERYKRENMRAELIKLYDARDKVAARAR